MPSKIVKMTGPGAMTKTDLIAFAVGAALAVPLLFLFLIHLLGGL